jgi:sigma-B regulation protein RsbU (phosphoserine phosphatase)
MSKTSSEYGSKKGVEHELDAFVATLASSLPAIEKMPYAIRQYLEDHPVYFACAIAVLESSTRVVDSPYLYRNNGEIKQTNLAVPSYDIDNQAWLTESIKLRKGVWTEPYFDAGGGEIWMITRSVPLFDGDHISAIVTTDLPVEPPEN